MDQLLIYLNSLLRSIHKTVYVEHLPDDAQYPAVVWNTPSSTEADFREDFTLIIDVWDNHTDNTRIERLTAVINDTLHRRRFLSEDGTMQLSFFRQTRGMVPDANPTYRRREIVFTVKAYFV